MNNHKTPGTDSVQNHLPLFFIGSSPSQASSILNPDFPASGAMVSINQLAKRKSDFKVDRWILDSGAFTKVARDGGYKEGVESYFSQISRWSSCGNLLIAVAEDWMCEPFVLQRTGLSIEAHQQLTIERYDALIKLSPSVPIMPVLQGYRSSDYLAHLQQYGDRLRLNQWVGIGSVCKRNGNSAEIANLLRGIKLLRPDLRLHGFGLKLLALENSEVRSLLYSCDSMAWSYPLRFTAGSDSVQNQSPLDAAHSYQKKVVAIASASPRIPSTAGAGNGQGRKPKWKSETGAIRLPKKYFERITETVRHWEKEDT